MYKFRIFLPEPTLMRHTDYWAAMSVFDERLVYKCIIIFTVKCAFPFMSNTSSHQILNLLYAKIALILAIYNL